MSGSVTAVDLDAIIQENARARAELMDAVDGLAGEQLREVWHGEWSLLDVVAHIAGAQEGYAEWLEHVARSEEPRITGYGEPGPPHHWNRVTVEARRDRDWERRVADLDVARERHEAAVRAVPLERYDVEEDGYPNDFTPWPNQLVHFAANVSRHERGHIAAILKWRSEQGS